MTIDEEWEVLAVTLRLQGITAGEILDFLDGDEFQRLLNKERSSSTKIPKEERKTEAKRCDDLLTAVFGENYRETTSLSVVEWFENDD